MHTVRIATNPRKWRRPAPCPACRKSRPLILTFGAIYKLRTRKPVNTIYGCICPNCRHKCILHVDGKNLKKAIRLWNHHHLSCRECRKWDVGPLHRLEYEGWQLNSTDPNDSLCPECVKAKEETK